MPAPDEIVVGPLTVWLAPLATSFPTLHTADGAIDAAWVKLGTEGVRNQEEDGVELGHGQTVEEFRGGGTTVRKFFRTEEDLTLGFTLVDLTTALYAKVINNATVTTVSAGASTSGQKHFSLKRGVDVAMFALLARGKSPADDSLVAQIEAYSVAEVGSPSPVHSKGAPAGLEVEFKAAEVTAGEFVNLRHQTAVPSS